VQTNCQSIFQLHTHSHWHTFTPFLVILITLTSRFQPTVILYKTAFDLCARDLLPETRPNSCQARNTWSSICTDVCQPKCFHHLRNRNIF
jgi:hypothetical protein